jgi:hypothetical protein
MARSKGNKRDMTSNKYCDTTNSRKILELEKASLSQLGE